MKAYNPKEIEKKWQKYWRTRNVFKTRDDEGRKKYYILDMFPYPSGVGLHVGHPKGYIATDVIARMKMMQGYNVLHPMGWDAFGLPAENYALKNKVHPEDGTKKNIAVFIKQLEQLGFTYDWEREINTTDPKYYRWTQWIFLQMFKRGLAYESFEPIIWCPSCKTGLANEDLEDGNCERCGSAVERRPIRQWVLKITDYADRLLNDLDKLPDWEESIKEMQRNWIGRSEGAEVSFLVQKFPQILLASTNQSKKNRVEKLLQSKGISTKISICQDVGIEPNEVEEDAGLVENAKKKARAYFGSVDMPILANDAALFIEDEAIDPIKVKRNALAGFDENDLTQEEISAKMLAYYKKIANDRGGEVDAYWKEAWVLLLPNGEMVVSESRRDITLTDKVVGPVDLYFPIRSLYWSKATGKYSSQETEEEIMSELSPVRSALVSLLCEDLKVFTTRPDTLYGVTYMVVAPEQTLISNIKYQISNIKEVDDYVCKSKNKSDLERTDLAKEKTGVELIGVKAINPVNNEQIPIFVADYVLSGYGTGAVMAVPAHDERDWEFANKFGLPIKQVVAPYFNEGYNPPRPDKKTGRRRTMHAIVRRPSDGKILLLDWKVNDAPGRGCPRTFIIGGVEDGEDIVDTAKREIYEETGYKNVRFIRKLDWEVHTEYFAGHKDENRYAEINVLCFDLENEERDEVDDSENKKHEPVWIDKKDVGSFVNVVDGPFIWGMYQQGGAFVGNGVGINSEVIDDLPTYKAKEKMIEWLVEKGLGKKQVQYKLRDWVFSRQRYWGEPIPLIKCEKCGWVPIPEVSLPLELPDVKNYEPSGTEESPLANILDWVNTRCSKCDGPAKRETNTMPQWAGSCWYYLRYIDPNNDKCLVDKEKEKYWSPVDFYVGGAEHATRHLIYARFWHKFLFDIGAVSNEEPFIKLQHVGLILGEDGRKMSKRWNNVVNPDDVVRDFGADTLRLFEMFMGPFDQPCSWNMQGLVGMKRFLERVWGMQEKCKMEDVNIRRHEAGHNKIDGLFHRTIKKVTEDIGEMRYNTAIAKLMELVNEMTKMDVTFPDDKVGIPTLSSGQYSILLRLLSPFAPHVCEELWEMLGNKESIIYSSWPEYDEVMAKESEISLVVQVNGKVRDNIVVSANIGEEEARVLALRSEKVQKWLAGKKPKKVIFVKRKLVSIVV